MWPLLLLLSPVIEGVALRRCVNGTLTDGACICNYGYTGTLCHRQMHCDTLDREEDGSCPACQEGWIGKDCDKIECGDHGTANGDRTRCTCNKPYSGAYCQDAHTEDVLLFYNNKSSSIGPIGALIIIPMVLTVFCCNKISNRQWSKKVEHHLETTVINQDLNSDVVHKLLYTKK